MSLKKFDLAKNLGLKISGQMKAAGVPGRFAQGATEVLDRKEQRRRDAAAGLVPFACKLPLDLVKQINERGSAHEGGVNGWLAEVIEKGLKPVARKASTKPAEEADEAAAPAKAPKKTAAKKKAADKPAP
ncbi:hypothetical protein [Piscinibacter terrae]|uniref:hypothetical protein n=1 Tax=Piscinibacter terrae TaxID=2496871 RepID=UPI0018E06C2B|nr:hypothetical protein [Albitalea terrae]